MHFNIYNWRKHDGQIIIIGKRKPAIREYAMRGRKVIT